jgi:Mrp family chromosome partitioning ATPase/capsular polysaccharide biosynthesis protein
VRREAQAAWTAESAEPEPVPPIVGYLSAIARHLRLCVVITLAALLGAAAWIATHPERYEATTQLLVTPLPEGDTSFVGLPIIPTQTADPARAVTTAATLAEDDSLPRKTSQRLNGEVSAAAVAAAVEVVPLADENIVEIKATMDDPQMAADVANAYATALLDLRREKLKPLIATAIDRTKSELAQLPDRTGLRATELEQRLAELQLVDDGKDPTLSVSQAAEPPTGPTGPSRLLILLAALAAGLAVAGITSIMIELLAPGAIDAEDELLRAYPLPVLARVPPRSRRARRRTKGSGLPDESREAFRTLRGQLELQSRLDGDRPGAGGMLSGVIAITSAMTGDGKTSAALGLAEVAAAAGSEVTVVDADLRKPEVAERLGAEPDRDLSAVLNGGGALGDLAAPAPGLAGVDFVEAPRTENLAMIERLGSMVPGLLIDGRRGDACIVVDTAALGEVSDALLILPAADQVVIAVRMRHTTQGAVQALRDSLHRAGVRPAGYVVFDSPLATSGPLTSSRRSAGRR